MRERTAANDELLRELGRITANFQALEMFLSLLAWSLLDPNQRIGKAVTSQLSFKNLCIVVHNLFQFRIPDEKLQSQLAKLLAEASDAEGKRNQLIHSTWLPLDENEEGISLIRMKITSDRKKGVVHQMPPTTTEDVRSVGDELGDLADRVSSLWVR